MKKKDTSKYNVYLMGDDKLVKANVSYATAKRILKTIDVAAYMKHTGGK